MAVTPVDLYAFGSRAGPRRPRVNKDLVPDASGMVGPEAPPEPFGASTFADPAKSLLQGHFHRLPKDTELPDGLDVVADGKDVNPSFSSAETHHTIYPMIRMPLERFIELFLGLPWQYAGRR